VRREFRITLAFYDRMQASLESLGQWDQPCAIPAVGTATADLPFWRIPTPTYLTFLTQNTNRFLFAFEHIHAARPTSRVSYEHSKLLTMVMQALRASFDSCDLPRARGPG